MHIILAPIMGITDHIYRTTFAEFFCGVEQAMAPFISSVAARSIKANYLKDLLPANNHALPVVPQILGKNADDFLFLASKIADLGYSTINWNLGCPSPTVVNKGRGSGLLPSPEGIAQFLDGVMGQLPCRLSIKLRLGRYAASELDQLWPIFNRYPLAEVIVHPRLGVQLYNGQVDLEAFRRCLTQTHLPLVYNGDIRTLADFIRLREHFPDLDRLMIGRGLLANPLLAWEIHSFLNPSLKCNREMAILQAFHHRLYERYGQALCGPSHLLSRLKGLWTYFADIFSQPDQVRKKIHRCQTLDRYQATVERFFGREEHRSITG